MSETAPGFAEYTPSRLEWLAVLLNSFLPYITFGESGYEIIFVPGNDGKTLILRLAHPADADREKIDHFINRARKFATEMASVYNWDSWIEFQIRSDSD